MTSKTDTSNPKPVLIHPTYFFSIEQASHLVKTNSVLFEAKAHYNKQTYRTRMHAYSPNGLLALNIPIKHHKTKETHQIMDQVKIENSFDWQTKHWRTLQTSYRSTPYFEHYEDKLYPLFHSPYELLIDFNLDCFKIICSILELDLEIIKTDEYKVDYGEKLLDCRDLVESKNKVRLGLEPYYQIFSDKGLGFLENLTTLDLIFHEGVNSSKGYLTSAFNFKFH
jgi:hypothetical protein